MRRTPSLSVDRFFVSREEIGTMPMSARPMKARPRPALRALVRRSVCSESPTGRAMPNRSPDPVGSAVATTIQSPTLVVPAGASAFVTLPPIASSFFLSSSVCV